VLHDQLACLHEGRVQGFGCALYEVADCERRSAHGATNEKERRTLIKERPHRRRGEPFGLRDKGANISRRASSRLPGLPERECRLVTQQVGVKQRQVIRDERIVGLR
jgi:hypothetical protein